MGEVPQQLSHTHISLSYRGDKQQNQRAVTDSESLAGNKIKGTEHPSGPFYSCIPEPYNRLSVSPTGHVSSTFSPSAKQIRFPSSRSNKPQLRKTSRFPPSPSAARPGLRWRRPLPPPRRSRHLAPPMGGRSVPTRALAPAEPPAPCQSHPSPSQTAFSVPTHTHRTERLHKKKMHHSQKFSINTLIKSAFWVLLLPSPRQNLV